MQVLPLIDDQQTLLGASINFTDVTRSRRYKQELEHANQGLEDAYAELQSTNEELETTNEELQSTVEELETTNEELQSTNEELETMNEEMQATNEELQTINDELGQRTTELDQLNAFLESIWAGLDGAVTVLDAELRVLVWNHGSEELWGVRQEEVQGQHFLNLDIGLPIEQVRPTLKAAMSGQNGTHSTTVTATNRRGRTVTCRVTCSPLVDNDKNLRGVIVLVVDEPDAGRRRRASQAEDAPHDLAAVGVVVDAPGTGELLDQPEPTPALRLPVGGDQARQPGPPSRTAMCSRSPRSSSRSRILVWAWATALVTSSLASSTARSVTVAPGRASRQWPHTSRTKARADPGAVGVGASRSSSRRYGGRAVAASRASWRLAYMCRKFGTRSRSRISATGGWARHSRKLVSGQRLAGLLATVEKTVAHTGSRVSTPARSQISAKGWSLRSFRSVRWIWGTLSRSMSPVKATTTQPSLVACWISMAHPQVAGCRTGLPTPRVAPLVPAGGGRRRDPRLGLVVNGLTYLPGVVPS